MFSSRRPGPFFTAILFLVVAVLMVRTPAGAQNFPPMTFHIVDSSSVAGYYFLSPYSNVPPYIYDRPQLILDKYGRIVFYRIFQAGPYSNPTIDFELHPDGRMSYFNTSEGKVHLVDSTFTETDTLSCAGFPTDQHDFRILTNGHYLLLGRETRIMNLSSYHWFGINHDQPGSTAAQVIGAVIQELDENKNLVWEWKASDHYQFGDVDQIWLFNPNKVDWTHVNAIEQDQDGNILISLRHFDEITKIDHTTGNIIWRFGGKQNQFTFTNDTVGFTGQHDIRRVSDTSVSLFDNGQYTNPPVARAVEYALDEIGKTATLAWSYVYDSSEFSIACGNHQYIGNENHLVDLGFTSQPGPWMVIVKPDHSKVLEVSIPDGYISYRAFNYLTLPWSLNRPTVDCQQIGQEYYLVGQDGYPEYRWSTGATTQMIPITDTGEYWVFVPYGLGYISSDWIHVTDLSNPCLFTGVPGPAPPSKELTLRVIPNPATDRAKIYVDLPVASSLTVTLQSIQGDVIRTLVAPGECYPPGRHELDANLSGLVPGMYLVVLSTDRHSLVVRRLVIKSGF
jgi:hypothetical protein